MRKGALLLVLCPGDRESAWSCGQSQEVQGVLLA